MLCRLDTGSKDHPNDWNLYKLIYGIAWCELVACARGCGDELSSFVDVCTMLCRLDTGSKDHPNDWDLYKLIYGIAWCELVAPWVSLFVVVERLLDDSLSDVASRTSCALSALSPWKGWTESPKNLEFPPGDSSASGPLHTDMPFMESTGAIPGSLLEWKERLDYPPDAIQRVEYSLIHRDTRPEPAIRCSTLRGAMRLPSAPDHRSEARLRTDPKVLVFVETLYSMLGKNIAELLVSNRIK
ncbi:Bifunctional heparan sulfate N-deacetylase/N-sulfotransferase [Habropoda laboriosa]|uniref:Bifunctional heparan sulfate N-deacetylase/N-sulfotransferase n=1 Tax=Habropoda laboriosa TaxID=597456 RepID=A0A0L7QT50_9HYME|nr:Bifunctional heparan sulfate N-deacetylase/N-sulfotransferase [Habropoda laboriosa]